MCLEYMEALNDKNTVILGLYESYLKFDLSEKIICSLPIQAILEGMAENMKFPPILI